MERLEAGGVSLISGTEAIDTTTGGGKLVFHIFAALAESERALIRERTRTSLSAARTRGRPGGRPRVLSDDKRKMEQALRDDPGHSVQGICKTRGISRSTFYRYTPGRRSGRWGEDPFPKMGGMIPEVTPDGGAPGGRLFLAGPELPVAPSVPGRGRRRGGRIMDPKGVPMRVQVTCVCLALLCALTVGSPASPVGPQKKKAAAFSFSGVPYFHRFSEGGQHEYTPSGQEDLKAWKDMVTIHHYPGVKDGEALAAAANAVLGNYKGGQRPDP
jgi:hypothetical protein